MSINKSNFLLGVWLVILLLTVNLLSGCKDSGENKYRMPIYGFNFSPYLDGQDPNLRTQINEAQLAQRMAIIAPYTEWVRTFGMDDGLEKSGIVAQGLNLKVALGAWISADASANEIQLEKLATAMLNDQADLVIVGSEVLLRGEQTENELIAYIQQIRNRSGGIPVAYADTYSVWLAHPALVSEVDVLLVNYYPYWEGVSADKALSTIHGWHQQMLGAAAGKPVIVGETGWPSDGDTVGNAVPSSENAEAFFMNFISWAEANSVKYFYFEAFDETWKAQYEGPQGAHWGVWNKEGVMKPGMQSVFDGVRIDDNWSTTLIE